MTNNFSIKWNVFLIIPLCKMIAYYMFLYALYVCKILITNHDLDTNHLLFSSHVLRNFTSVLNNFITSST